MRDIAPSLKDSGTPNKTPSKRRSPRQAQEHEPPRELLKSNAGALSRLELEPLQPSRPSASIEFLPDFVDIEEALAAKGIRRGRTTTEKPTVKRVYPTEAPADPPVRAPPKADWLYDASKAPFSSRYGQGAV